MQVINFLFISSFDLTARVTFYADCVPAGQTLFSWSVDNDNVVLNLKTFEKSTLHVDANSLPGMTAVLVVDSF